jgi:hypothetical protein
MPELQVALWHGSDRAACVAMPKASVNEHDRAQARENQVRTPGEGQDIQAVAQPHRVQQATECQLRPGVRAPDARHPFGSLAWRERVGHGRRAMLREGE